MATASEVFALAWQNHQAGNYNHAERLYQQILQADPSHTDAWCFLGAACQAQGKLAEAEANFRRAVQLMPSHPSAQNCLGVLLAQQGKLADAASCFQQMLLYQPGDPEANNNLGLVRVSQGLYDEAIASFQRATQLRPGYQAAEANLEQALQAKRARGGQFAPPAAPPATVGAYPVGRASPPPATVGAPPPLSRASADLVLTANQRGVAFAQQNRLEDAIACFRQALQIAPDSADSYNNLGIVLDLQGKTGEAVQSYQRALRLNPRMVAAHYNMAIVLHKIGRLEEAFASFQEALRLKPDHVDALINLGILLMDLGRLDEAIAQCQRALRIDPNNASAYTNLGNIYQRQNKIDDSVRCYQEALRINPNFAEAHNNLGKSYQDLRKYGEAVDSYEKALRLKPNFAEAHYNLGNALRDLGNLEEAIEKYKQSIRLKPDFHFGYNNLGDALLKQGRPDLAMPNFRQALRFKADMATAQSNVLFCLNYDPYADPDAVFAEHLSWGRLFPTPRGLPPFANDPSPERRLRIGYVSPDLRFHPLTRYFEPVLAHHDPKNVEVFCYAELLHPDSVTKRLQQLAHGWRCTSFMTDAEFAQQVRNDRIDILVDLAGHTANNRLRVFAHKPAPVQATWLGYMNTTGLAAIDYRLTDDVLDPPGHPVRDSEKLVRLARGMCCFQAPADAPEVGPLPALERGHITFGSLHNLFKLNGALFDLWCRVLKAVPTSRLLFFRDTMTATGQRYIREQFQQRGIGEERVDLRLGSCGPGYLAIFNEIDVTLDAYPCTGGVTTCESLWMGVPVLSLCGVRPASRNSAALLARVGLTDWAVNTPDDYLASAVGLATKLDQLATVRAGLRERMSGSLCDARAFTPVVEEAFRTMWRNWCAGRGTGGR